MSARPNRAVVSMLLCQLLWPGLMLFSYLSKWEFYFHSEILYLLLICTLTGWLHHALIIDNQTPAKWLCLLLFPITILVCALEVLFFRRILPIPLTVLNCYWAGSVFTRFLPDRWYKILGTLVCTLLIMGYGLICFLSLTFGQIGRQSIVQEVTSPDGQKIAQLIDDDQGALGGNTLIYVRYQDTLSLGFGAIRPDSLRVHHGPWGQFQDLTLSWRDDNTLLVNDTPIQLDEKTAS